MVLIETSFPRGGSIKTQSPGNEKLIFGARQEKKISKKPKPQEYNEDSNKDIQAISAELLNLKTIQEGMLVMGTIKNADPVYLKISLPGRLVGKIVASSVSDSYTEILNQYVKSSERVDNFKHLNDLYHVGQIVYTKVIAITENDGQIEINLSLKPSDVHSNLRHENIKRGMLFNGAIKEIQEHGYVIETGIKNLRCFLPSENTGKDNYSIGELIFMKVDKLTQSPAASTAICKKMSGEKRKIRDLAEPILDYILPSTVVNFTVTKILKDGLQGTIMNEAFTGYVNEHQLNEPLAVPEDFDINSTIKARVLYVMPLTKLVYLSLNFDISKEDEAPLQRGQIIEDAVVQRIGTGGVILVLNECKKGLISLKSVKANYVGNYDQDEILSKYTKNSKHKVRIINFNRMDSLYMCTDDPKIINEKYFCGSDLNPGDFVTATINGKNKVGGYYVHVGNVKGMLEGIYLSSKLELKDGSKIRCRVLGLNTAGSFVYLTNRSEYMNKDSKLLTKLTQAKKGKVFIGTIVKCGTKFLTIKFGNNIKGVFYKNMTNDFSSFYEGQTMPFRIISREDEKIIVGLVDDMYKIGDICSATVNTIIENGLDIVINDENSTKALVPFRFLSDFADLVIPQLKTYKVGDELKVVCVGKTTFSVRDVDYFTDNLTIRWNTIKIGDILRAFVKNVDNDVVQVLIPTKDGEKFVKIHVKMFLSNAVVNPNVTIFPDQMLFVKVLSKLPTKNFSVSAKLIDVWDCTLKTTAEMTVKYLEELQDIAKSLKNQGKPIGNLEIGDQVSGEVVLFDQQNNICRVKLPNGIEGIIKSTFITKSDDFKIGKELKLVLLWIDYDTETVFVSHKKCDFEHIAKSPSLPERFLHGINVKAKVLIITPNITVCSIKKGQNPLVFVPTKLHYNDFENSLASEMHEGDFCHLSFIHEKYPIAVTESTRKLWADVSNAKRKTFQNNNDEVTPIKKIKLDNSVQYINKDSTMEDNSTKRHKADLPHKKVKKRDATISQKIDINKDDCDSDILSLADLTNASVPYDKTSGISDMDVSESFNNDLDENLGITTGDEMNESKQKEKKLKRKRSLKDIEQQPIEESKKTCTEQAQTNKKTVLPGASNFWSSESQLNDKTSANNDESSEDEDDNQSKDIKKKKKLTPAEKIKAAKEEEARLREIEEKYANPNLQPETADQFDRLVLAKPNNSLNWINYMVFHLQATEIDKARTIARKALKTISFREEQELINIWVALLNLELRYGTKESFTETLKESLLSNDAYKIYSRVIQILSDAKKTQELSDIINTVTKKFKDKSEIWKICANAYFDVGLSEKAKQLLHRALAALPERDHINTIVTFANLNHKHGDKETAHALLEQIITSYPKRVDVWSQYVDMLIKDKEIESARRTLDRAVIQKIPMKKMRTLFKKYLEFEERFGTAENVYKVKAMAESYVKNETQAD